MVQGQIGFPGQLDLDLVVKTGVCLPQILLILIVMDDLILFLSHLELRMVIISMKIMVMEPGRMSGH